MSREMWFGETWEWTDIYRWERTVTVGTQFLWNTALVDCRYCSLLRLTAYWIAWWHLKFCWSSGLVYINLTTNRSLYVCVCVHDFLTLKEFVGFHETEENFMPFEATQTHNIKFPTRSYVNLSYRSFICDPDIV